MYYTFHIKVTKPNTVYDKCKNKVSLSHIYNSIIVFLFNKT